MKRALAFAIAGVLALALVSCQKQTGGSAQAAPGSTPGSASGGAEAPKPPAPPPVLTVDARSGFVLRDADGLYAVTGGVAQATGSLGLGEIVELQTDMSDAELPDGTRASLVKVKRANGDIGWARADSLASNCTIAVVTSSGAAVFKEPDEGSATGQTIPGTGIVAILEDDGDSPFLKVALVDPSGQALSSGVYIRRDGYSRSPDDVLGAALYRRAEKESDPAQKRALLETATQEHPGSRYITMIEDALAPLATTSDTRGTEKFFATLVSTDDRVNVRDAPDEKKGKVVGQIGRGQKVDVEEKTTAEFTVAGRTGPWYRISEPAGWVFGAWLTPEE